MQGGKAPQAHTDHVDALRSSPSTEPLDIVANLPTQAAHVAQAEGRELGEVCVDPMPRQGVLHGQQELGKGQVAVHQQHGTTAMGWVHSDLDR